MTEAITREEMQNLDRRAIEVYGIPEPLLMEVAGFQIFLELRDRADSFLIFCSSGNNGGDGFVVARHLFISGKKVRVVNTGKVEKMKASTLDNYNALRSLGVPIFEPEDKKWEDRKTFEKIQEFVDEAGCVVDALFGTGLSREISGKYRSVIEMINSGSVLTVAVDIPSGIDATVGKVLGTAVKADITITMHRPKTGFAKAADYTGEVITKYIGIPENI